MNQKKEMKKWIILILVAVISYWVISHLNLLGDIVGKLINILFPFILGSVIAFILNIPMSKIEKILKKHMKKKLPIRVFSIILSLLIFIAVIIFVAFLLIPELVNNIQVLIDNIPILISNVQNFTLDLLSKYPDIQNKISEIFAKNINASSILANLLNYIVNGAIDFISSLVSGIVTLFTSIIFAVYMLSQKEYLIRNGKKITYAYLKKEKADKLIEIASLSNKTFSKFISGQCVEAILLGSIFFVVLSIFRFPYALLISVLTSITALIPIFGALIAMIVGAILIAITNPIQAIIFIIVFLIIQQIEGNFIYPRIVGKSVGLSPMWTLLAISVGGSVYGVVGMLLILPIASIIYSLIKRDVNVKLKKKKILDID